MQLQDRNVVVTGASHGIGTHLASAFAGCGANLLLVAQTEAALEKVAERIRQHGVRVVVAPSDLALSDQRLALVERAQAELGIIDVLVNNAAVGNRSCVRNRSQGPARARGRRQSDRPNGPDPTDIAEDA